MVGRRCRLDPKPSYLPQDNLPWARLPGHGAARRSDERSGPRLLGNIERIVSAWTRATFFVYPFSRCGAGAPHCVSHPDHGPCHGRYGELDTRSIGSRNRKCYTREQGGRSSQSARSFLVVVRNDVRIQPMPSWGRKAQKGHHWRPALSVANGRDEALAASSARTNFQMMAPRHLPGGPSSKLFNSFLAIHAFP